MAENSNRNAACKPQFENPCPPNIKKACPAQNEKETKTETESCPKTEDKTEVKEKKCRFNPGFDARFPNTNQTRRCWQNYVDYFRCHERYGEEHEPCEYFKKVYKTLCPDFWNEQWDDQRENNTFPWPHRR
ncbi:uncharacterized protein LOC131949315 [Physella acuta]|uniref:uncharacterized protein LOC131949315 n=1 Tax=Physella acuta TaxID=109671 RepID=UPI0027DC62E4|nr:uncharacterized protein LOC131949315 [Physella acuta]